MYFSYLQRHHPHSEYHHLLPKKPQQPPPAPSWSSHIHSYLPQTHSPTTASVILYVSSFNRWVSQNSERLLKHIPEARDWPGFEPVHVKMLLVGPVQLVSCFVLSRNPTKWNLARLRPAGAPKRPPIPPHPHVSLSPTKRGQLQCPAQSWNTCWPCR